MEHMREALEFREVNRERWSDLEHLFENRGGPMYCWCMPYRIMTPNYGRADNEAKKEALHGYVTEGTPIGILGYLDHEPVAWCSIGPIETYRNLRGRGYVSGDEDEKNIWSIVCFFIRSGFRHQGFTSKLIAAAIEYARDRGAEIVEAYPVDPDSPSYRFMGFIGTFEAMGFQEVGMVGIRRHMMRLRLV